MINNAYNEKNIPIPSMLLSVVILTAFFLLITTGQPVNLVQLMEQPVYAASLSIPSAIPTNNLVSTTSTYEITFSTATAGTIKTVKIVFPSGYNVAGTKLIEKEGIGTGSIAIVGNTVTYNVNSPVNVPVGTPIRLELSNIVNKITTASPSVSIATNNANGVIIDGPTAVVVPLKQIRTEDIANNAVTNTKIGGNSVTGMKIADGNVSSSDLADNAITSQKILDGQVTAEKLSPTLMYTKRLFDTTCVNSEFGVPIGWCPSGQPGKNHFVIKDSDLVQVSWNNVKNILISLPGTVSNCWANTGASDPNYMFVDCAQPPLNGATLAYTVIGPKVLENNDTGP
jgi:hypothetical protein